MSFGMFFLSPLSYWTGPTCNSRQIQKLPCHVHQLFLICSDWAVLPSCCFEVEVSSSLFQEGVSLSYAPLISSWENCSPPRHKSRCCCQANKTKRHETRKQSISKLKQLFLWLSFWPPKEGSKGCAMLLVEIISDISYYCTTKLF